MANFEHYRLHTGEESDFKMLEPFASQFREILLTRVGSDDPNKLFRYFGRLMSDNFGISVSNLRVRDFERNARPPENLKASNKTESTIKLLSPLYEICGLIRVQLIPLYDNRIRLQKKEIKIQRAGHTDRDTETAEAYLAAASKEDEVRQQLKTMIQSLDFSNISDQDMLVFVLGKNPSITNRAEMWSMWQSLYDAL